MAQQITERLARARSLLGAFKLPEALIEAELALAALEETPDPALRAEAHELAGLAANGVGRFLLAEEHLRQAILLLDEPGEQQRLLSCQLSLAECLVRQGDLLPARHLAKIVLDKAQEGGWRELVARAWLCEGNLAWAAGDPGEAQRLIRQALEAFHALGQAEGANHARSALAVVHAMLGEDDQAERLLKEVLAVFQQQKDYGRLARCLNNLGGIAYRRGDRARAREYLLQCVELEADIHARGDLSSAWFNLGLIELEAGSNKLARKYFHRALQIAQESGDRSGQGATLLHLGIAAFEEGNYAEALNLGELAVASYEGSPSDRGRAVQSYLPVLLLAAGQLALAKEKWAARPPLRDMRERETLAAMLNRLVVQSGGQASPEVTALARQWRADLLPAG